MLLRKLNQEEATFKVCLGFRREFKVSLGHLVRNCFKIKRGKKA